jgi:transcriptional regulator with XRE-family HTH domain
MPGRDELGAQPVKRLLQAANMSQRELAAALGSQPGGWLSKVLNGHLAPSPQAAARIAAVLGRSVDECFTPRARAGWTRRPAPPGELGVQPVKALLGAAGISQKAVAAALGWTTHRRVGKVLNGRQRPSSRTAQAMASLVGKPVDACFTAEALRPATRARRPASTRFGIQPVKRFLAEAGMTYAQVSDVVGVCESRVAQIVNGHSLPTIDAAARIAALVTRPVTACFTPQARLRETGRRRSGSASSFGVQPVRDMLVALGINEPTAAQVLGCSATYVNDVVRGTKRPSLVVAARMARLVGRPIAACFRLDDVKPEPDAPAAGRYGVQPLGALLDDAGLSPAQAAHTVNLTVRSMEQILSGRSRPSLDRATALARLVGRPLEDCFTDEVFRLDEEVGEVGEGTVDHMVRRQGNPATPGPLGVQPVKKILAEAHITHEDAGAAIGFTQQQVTAVVNGQFPASITFAFRLARLVDRPIEECFTIGGRLPAVRSGTHEPGPYGLQPLRALLGAAGMTQSHAAAAARLPQVFVRRVLAGDVRPTIEQAVLLARLVDRPIEECFSEEMLGLAEAASATK